VDCSGCLVSARLGDRTNIARLVLVRGTNAKPPQYRQLLPCAGMHRSRLSLRPRASYHYCLPFLRPGGCDEGVLPKSPASSLQPHKANRTATASMKPGRPPFLYQQRDISKHDTDCATAWLLSHSDVQDLEYDAEDRPRPYVHQLVEAAAQISKAGIEPPNHISSSFQKAIRGRMVVTTYYTEWGGPEDAESTAKHQHFNQRYAHMTIILYTLTLTAQHASGILITHTVDGEKTTKAEHPQRPVGLGTQRPVDLGTYGLDRSPRARPVRPHYGRHEYQRISSPFARSQRRGR
jgi:hypothetical protein